MVVRETVNAPAAGVAGGITLTTATGVFDIKLGLGDVAGMASSTATPATGLTDAGASPFKRFSLLRHSSIFNAMCADWECPLDSNNS
jgi:hypothetical protein